MTSGLARSGTADPSGVSNLLATIYAVLHPLEFIESIRSKPEREKRYEFLRLAKAQCEEATKKLPEFIDLDEFVDEGGAITTDLIFDYLKNGISKLSIPAYGLIRTKLATRNLRGLAITLVNGPFPTSLLVRIFDWNWLLLDRRRASQKIGCPCPQRRY
jgi:hypothetical protein